MYNNNNTSNKNNKYTKLSSKIISIKSIPYSDNYILLTT